MYSNKRKDLTVEKMFVVVLLLSLLVCGQSLTDDLVTVRDRVLSIGIWPSKENLSSVAADAVEYTHALNDKCEWPDLNYHDRNISNWAPYNHMLRLTVMFQALTAPGSPVQNHTKLGNASRCALNVWLVNDWQDPNWWFNQIGIPLFATSQLLMLGESATEFEREKIKNISYRADWWHGHEGTGANLVWMLQIQLYRSLATNNLTGVEQAFPVLWNDVKILPLGGQGMQADLSYHFHGLLLLSGTYGQEWAVALLILILSTQGTKYQVGQEQLNVFGRFLADGDAWMTVGNVWDWAAIGRHVDRPHLERLTFITPDWIRSFAQLIQDKEINLKLLNWADRLECLPNATPLIGNKHFFTSDFQVHRRKTWSSSLKVQSPRTVPTECIIGENQKAEHLGQGILNLWTNDIEVYVQIFALLDWQVINGITVEHGIPLEPCDGGHFHWTPKHFVGGVSDGNYGLTVMDTQTHNLTALRSWSFYDDMIIALASNLTLTSKNEGWTTLASRLLPQGVLTVAFFNNTIVSLPDGVHSFPYVAAHHPSNVQWFHIGGSNIAYLLQTQSQYAELGFDLRIKTNNYDTFGPFIFEKTARIFTAWINHGKGPFTRDYQYIILPNVQLEDVPSLIKRYNEENVFSCLTSNDILHATAYPSLQRVSFVLWNNQTSSITCKSPSFDFTAELNNAGLFLFNETATEFSITASHPTSLNQSLTVTVNRLGSGAGCQIQSNSNPTTTKVTLPLPTLPELLGQSVTVTCKKTTMNFY